MSHISIARPTPPAIALLDHCNELARVLAIESLMDHAPRLDDGEAAVLVAMGAIARRDDPLCPFGIAGDAAIAWEACIELYRARRALASLRNRGLVDSCVGALRWSLTDDGRARIASTMPTQEPTP